MSADMSILRSACALHICGTAFGPPPARGTTVTLTPANGRVSRSLTPSNIGSVTVLTSSTRPKAWSGHDTSSLSSLTSVPVCASIAGLVAFAITSPRAVSSSARTWNTPASTLCVVSGSVSDTDTSNLCPGVSTLDDVSAASVMSLGLSYSASALVSLAPRKELTAVGAAGT